jgi:hypothetical protein
MADVLNNVSNIANSGNATFIFSLSIVIFSVSL